MSKLRTLASCLTPKEIGTIQAQERVELGRSPQGQLALGLRFGLVYSAAHIRQLHSCNILSSTGFLSPL